MAIMLPEKPKQLDGNSMEDIMFEGLSKLPDDYYVFHSFRILLVENNMIRESETDFVIFNRDKGILCIEAKAGHVKYEKGVWVYASGIMMKGDGPFSQVSRNKWNLKKVMDEKCEGLSRHCKILQAVWFPSISGNEIMNMTFPPEANKNTILCKDAVENPQKFIDKIFDLNVSQGLNTSLTNGEIKQILDDVLCPTFELVPSKAIEIDVKKNRFNRLLEEQSCILDFLDEQRVAVINGVAGTGKTMIAIEKARRSALDGKVLFLCFNIRLKEYLVDNYKYANIDFYTIDGFACMFCNTNKADFVLLKEKLIKSFNANTFPYKHIVIDEGQDFGQVRIEESDIIQMLESNVLNKPSGTFYMFYDKLQLVQGVKIPRYIEEADCRLTLYKNCRNTRNIAATSLKPLDKKPKLFDGAVDGDLPRIHFANGNNIEMLNKILDRSIEKNIDDAVLLTCKTEESSFIYDSLNDGFYEYKNNKYLLNSCRRFKGLEADEIIMIDIDGETLLNNEKLFYVGTSRARINLEIIANIDDEWCTKILEKLKMPINSRNLQKQLASALGCFMV